MTLHRWIKVAIAFVIAMTLVSSFAPISTTNAQPAAQDFSATVEPIGGLVQQLAAGENTWQTLSKVTLLHKGDQVRTGTQGTAHLNTVTGIKVNLFPNTLIQLKSLSLGSGNESSLKFSISQVSGVTFTSVDQALKQGDSVEVLTPTANATIHGTSFYTLVTRDGNTIFVGRENNEDIRDINGNQISNGPDNFTYFTFNVPQGQAGQLQACTLVFLGTNSRGSLVQNLDTDQNRGVLRDFLKAWLVSDANPDKISFFATLLGMTGTPTVQEIQDKLATFNDTESLQAALGKIRGLLDSYFASLSTTPLPSASCGNGKNDTSDSNCPDDTSNIQGTTGNNVCDANESQVNAAADCLPLANLLQSCANLIDTVTNQGTNQAGGGGNGNRGGNGGGNGNPPANPPAQGQGQGRGRLAVVTCNKNGGLTPSGVGVSLGQCVSYTVQQGDTLPSVASQFGVTPQQIINANKNMNFSPGQGILIPLP